MFIYGMCDIALIELGQPVRSIIPTNINYSFDELGADAIVVGFGVSGIVNQPETVDIHHKKIAGEY